MEVPLYIERLWNHYTFNRTITLTLTHLTNDYRWMSSLFIKMDDVNSLNSPILLDVAKICAIFNKANTIVFMMPNEHILSHDQCSSLVEDLASISVMNIDVTIRVKWPLEMPRASRDHIKQYSFTASSEVFAPDSISFRCNLVSRPSVVQNRVEHERHFDQVKQNAQRDVSTAGKRQTTRVLDTVEAYLLYVA
eukprot:990168_1